MNANEEVLMMKRLWLLAFALTLCLWACGDTSQAEEKAERAALRPAEDACDKATQERGE